MGADYQQYPFPQGSSPPGWIETTISEVTLEVRSGYSSGKHNQTGYGIPHLRPMNVSPEGEILLEDVRYVLPSAGNLRLMKNDVLFTNTSSTAWVGKTAVVTKPANWGFSNHMTRLRVAKCMSPEFVARQLHYLCLCGYFAFHCKKHINQSGIGTKQLVEKVPFRLPPRDEQKRISAKLDNLLAREHKLRDQLREITDIIQQYRAAVLDAACTGQLVTTEAKLARISSRTFMPASALLENILAERRATWEARQLTAMRSAGNAPKSDKWKEKYTPPVRALSSTAKVTPEGWVFASLDELLTEDLCNGVSVAGSDNPPGIPALRLSAMNDSGFDYTKIRYLPLPANDVDDLWIQEGDFFVSRGNGSLQLVGRGTIAQKPPLKVIFPDTMIRLRFASALKDSQWLTTIWKSGFVRQQLLRRAKTTAGIWKISQVSLKNLLIPLPPPEEQKRIVAEVSKRFAAVEHIEQEVKAALETTKRLRVAFLHRAFYGNLVTQFPEDESASILLEKLAAEKAAFQEIQEKDNSMSKRLPTSGTKRELLEVLGEQPEGLSPEQLMMAAGYTSEEVPMFYKALQKVEKLIHELRPQRKTVILKRRKS